MEIQIAALCDSADDYNGKLCLLGTFDTIMAQSFPFLHRQCVIALRLLFREDDAGVFPGRISIVNEDGQPIVPPIQTSLEIRIPDNAVFFTRNIVCHLRDIKFDRPGYYSVDVAFNGRPIASIPFRVLQFQPPPQPTPEQP